MRQKFLKSLLAVAFIFTSVLQAGTLDLEKYGAGRVRYVEGDGALLTFGKQQVAPDIDYLVLLGSVFDTGNARMEVVTLNGNTYWMDKGTEFHFESMDNRGPESSMFLGKGAFVVDTVYPFTLTTGAGSVYFPDKGTYVVMKDAFGKDKLYIYTWKGTKPATVKKSTLFSRIKYEDDLLNKDLMDWVNQRRTDWKKTLVRCNIFSHVDKMPPYMAVTDENGNRQWKKVNSIQPIYRMTGIVDGNWFFYQPDFIHAMGLWSPYSTYMSDIEMALYFATNQYNSVRWAWDVANGWHAEWYYDPLAGFGAQYQYPMWRYRLAGQFWGPYPWNWMWPDPHMGYDGLFYDRSGHENIYYLDAWLSTFYQRRDPTFIVRSDQRDGRPAFDSRIPVREGRMVRRVQINDRAVLRQTTDSTLMSRQMATRLSFDNRDMERAQRKIEVRRSPRIVGSTSSTGRTSSGRTMIRSTTTSSTSSRSVTRSSSGSSVGFRGPKVVTPPRR